MGFNFFIIDFAFRGRDFFCTFDFFFRFFFSVCFARSFLSRFHFLTYNFILGFTYFLFCLIFFIYYLLLRGLTAQSK